MSTKSIGSGFKIKDGRVVKRAPRMAAGQAKNKHQQAARIEKRLRNNAAKARGKK